jgi:hypothetical protein
MQQPIDDQASGARRPAPTAREGRSGQLALIRSLLAQTPEERLLGLRRAAAFFQAAKRG